MCVIYNGGLNEVPPVREFGAAVLEIINPSEAASFSSRNSPSGFLNTPWTTDINSPAPMPIERLFKGPVIQRAATVIKTSPRITAQSLTWCPQINNGSSRKKWRISHRKNTKPIIISAIGEPIREMAAQAVTIIA